MPTLSSLIRPLALSLTLCAAACPVSVGPPDMKQPPPTGDMATAQSSEVWSKWKTSIADPNDPKETWVLTFDMKESGEVAAGLVEDYTESTSPLYKCHFEQPMTGQYILTDRMQNGVLYKQISFTFSKGSASLTHCNNPGKDTTPSAVSSTILDTWNRLFSRAYSLEPGQLILFAPTAGDSNFVFTLAP